MADLGPADQQKADDKAVSRLDGPKENGFDGPKENGFDGPKENGFDGPDEVQKAVFKD
ncbi:MULTISPECIES: hypothetical protein [Streptomyces]|uniref:Uncharacterized protein n=1 Tax=Streptomyces violaceoruber TaxID=1935 RepID=A0ACD4WF99_STRVN|nr:MULTISPECIES: hypothetical protein [Streptomyces]WOY96448.1 hypothetical protein R2E43_02925 [Streptomyces violaceoruber]BDD76624.1 hypothetical protein JCM4020_72440 [Streptomyces coelicolor]MDX3343906.1 hypothetical protein [Streptomyces sp. ME02-6979A]MDX3366159.1 hypothetical protein [Streptomyces sp. ME02-6987-2C]MDX3422462.1 hypothetical protein [Streptomyces sp. ME02-6985-2c]